MARIPGPQDFATVRPPSPVEDRAAGAEEAQMADFAGSVMKIGSELRARRQASDDAGFRTSFQVRAKPLMQAAFEEAKKKLPETGVGFAEALQPEFQKIKEQVLKEAEEKYRPSQSARIAVDESFSSLTSTFLTSAVAFENNASIDAVNRDLNLGVESAAQGAFQDPDTFEEAISEVDQIYEIASGTQFSGDIADSQRLAKNNVAISTVRGRIKTNPYLAIQEIKDGKYNQYLEASDIVTLTSEALSAAESMESKAKQAAKDRKESNEALFTARFFDPSQEPPEDIELVNALNFGLIDQAGFNRLRGYKNAEFTKESDSATRLGLMQLANEASPLVPGLLLSQVEAGNLSQDDAAAIMNSYQSARDKGGALSDPVTKQQRRRIDQVVGGVRGPLAILDTASSARVANALQEFDERVLGGEDPTEVAEDIIPKFRLSPPSPTEFSKPLYLVGQRSSPDIEATRAATLDALERGDITETEAARELENLNDIQSAISERLELDKSRRTPRGQGS